MLELINEDPELKVLYDLITSVKCVGNVLATELLVYTDGFTRMTNKRQLACYCGVAPFEHSSGTSIRGRAGTSNFANMKLKSTLHMAAVSSLRYVPDIKQYYERKVSEGKHKMTVINAIRNKLIQRVMAVVKRGTPYQENYSKINLELS
jgi:transposase